MFTTLLDKTGWWEVYEPSLNINKYYHVQLLASNGVNTLYYKVFQTKQDNPPLVKMMPDMLKHITKGNRLIDAPWNVKPLEEQELTPAELEERYRKRRHNIMFRKVT